MRGTDDKQASMFSVVSPEERIPADHPLRRIKALADAILAGMSGTFDAMYGKTGRPSIPPERLLKAQVLIALYSVRSDRQFCEQLDYNLLFRWFLDMNADEATFNASSFSRNRDRLLDHEVAATFFAGVVAQRVYANAEAIGLYDKGVALLRMLPESRDRAALELALQTALVVPLASYTGYSTLELLAACERARALADELGEAPNPAVLRALRLVPRWPTEPRVAPQRPPVSGLRPTVPKVRSMRLWGVDDPVRRSLRPRHTSGCHRRW